ncbi:CHASE2 domain-containing protein [Thauera humireducens]|uniref:CHASE2 domain-containing protein n=1 Tax=Thauera humireducens TaxID=1134435 RepID=UPI0024A8F49B|nr:adenylate/guanylate cyclase domain-containing protein [Thauera humireducens]
MWFPGRDLAASMSWGALTIERRRAVRFLIGLLAFAVAVALSLPRERGQLLLPDELLRDAFLRTQVHSQPERRLAIIDIDESSLVAQGAWPWPRERIADLAETLLFHYRARGLALDILFPEPGDPVGDARLATLAMHAPLTLAVALSYEREALPVNTGHLPHGNRFVPVDAALDADGFVGNHAGFANATCVGNIGFLPDKDGALRRLPMFSRLDGVTFAHLSFALLTCSQSLGGNSVVIPPFPILQGAWRIPIRRSAEAYTVIPAAAILSRQAPAELLEGRWVIVGASALSLGDRVTTPLSSNAPGLLVHALAISALLDASEAGAWKVWSGAGLALTWASASLLFLLWVLPRVPVWVGTSLLLLSALAWVTGAFFMTAQGGVVPVVPVLAAYLVVLLLAIPYEWWLSQRESRGVLRMFSQYLSPSVVAELMRIGPDEHLQPALKEVTVLIADMEGYTVLTSSLSLVEAVELTQRFLGCLTRPILEEGGTLDKYTGDGVVAFWGAPLPCTDHADRALSAAMNILVQVQETNQQRIAAGKRPVRVRIGIESGLALVGDLGTEFRSAYTAVGDCINFASKLQETARRLPVDIVVGPKANASIKAHSLTSIGMVEVRGAGQALELFTPVNTVKSST